MNIKLVILILSLSAPALSQVIEFPESELAKESVLPIFDKVEVVKNRNVPTEGRFELGGGMGLNLTEALYDNKSLNLNLTYNFTTLHAINFIGIWPIEGLSSMGQNLALGKGMSGKRFDASLAPFPQSFMSLNYQIAAYYGKISLSKNRVMNLALYGMAGLSRVGYQDTNPFGAQVGIGQKLYLNKDFAIRFDLLGVIYRGPDPTSAADLDPSRVNNMVPSSSLEEVLYFRSFLNAGLVYLL